ncbi:MULTISPECIES: (d)CMP kinase [unclassified Granulicatella]|uniref:(d)CMP kinase n=1 Tax=unclassified Granulicatella TaxID=2630493 RepID=UPI00107307A5|nr:MULTISPECIES: (d)CMP kinase [unclassified Granulicatella]MBF0780041.1 (d)CMP kinase [Granulicatella sp. 19428wC4_WM01]TFU95890.1 (d)CMP kinase [Granulicatella sp. WM01]
MKKIRIAIDGPASSGKSTVAKQLAQKLQYVYLDTGAMYRCMTLSLLEHHVDLTDETLVSEWIKKQKIEFITHDNQQSVLLNGENVTLAIREARVSKHVSLISSYKHVREELVRQQRAYIQQGGIIMDGRDIGTVVMPEAELKIFMVASAYERAKRRYQEHVQRGDYTQSVEEIQRQIEKRDYIDSTRLESPLTKANDAIEIDTTELNINQVVEKIMSYL